MKVMTVGWISVFLLILLMNIYIWNFYWQIPFSKARVLKIMNYLVIHLALAIVSIHYFYLFFNAKTDRRQTKSLSYIAGFYLTFLHYSMIFHLVHDLVYATRNIFPYPQNLKRLGNKLFFGGFLIFGVTAVISLISIYNAQKVVVKSYSIGIDKKASKLDKLKIVYISDAHIGTSVNLENIDELIEDIEKLKPDILFLGGDFLDEGTTEKDKELALAKLSKIKTKYGSFAVEGNHEYKSGDCNINYEMQYFSQTGIRVLQDQVYRVEDSFYIIGRKDKYGKIGRLDKLVDQAQEDLPIILLDHRPTFKESQNLDRIDLQLSGHTHSGQFFPVQILNPLVKRISQSYVYGHHKVGNMHHIVSSGIGNWGIPVRLGSKREIVEIILELE